MILLPPSPHARNNLLDVKEQSALGCGRSSITGTLITQGAALAPSIEVEETTLSKAWTMYEANEKYNFEYVLDDVV